MASRWARLFAHIADGLVYAIPGLVLAFGLMLLLGQDPNSMGIAVGVYGIAVFLIFVIQTFLLARDGQTIGKKLLQIRIVDVNKGAPKGFLHNVLIRAWLNNCLGVIPFYTLVDLLMIFGSDKRCVHDLLAGTCVVSTSGNAQPQWTDEDQGFRRQEYVPLAERIKDPGYELRPPIGPPPGSASEAEKPETTQSQDPHKSNLTKEPQAKGKLSIGVKLIGLFLTLSGLFGLVGFAVAQGAIAILLRANSETVEPTLQTAFQHPLIYVMAVQSLINAVAGMCVLCRMNWARVTLAWNAILIIVVKIINVPKVYRDVQATKAGIVDQGDATQMTQATTDFMQSSASDIVMMLPAMVGVLVSIVLNALFAYFFLRKQTKQQFVPVRSEVQTTQTPKDAKS